MKALGVLLLVLALFLGYGLLHPSQPVDAVASCEREFGAGTEAAQRCELRLLTERAQQVQDQRMDRAREDM